MVTLAHFQRCIAILLFGWSFLGLTSLFAQNYLLEIDFPEDAATICGSTCIPELSRVDEGCAMLLISQDTARFEATSEECYKLAITYDIIDWCLWDGEVESTLIRRRTEDQNDPLAVDLAVERSERPILRIEGLDAHNLSVTLDRRHNHETSSTCGNLDDGSELPDNDTDYPTNDNDSYRGDLLSGRWRYTQFIKIYDNNPPVVAVPEYGGPTDACPTLSERQFADVFEQCGTRVRFTFSVADACDLLDDTADDVVLLSAEFDEYAHDVNGDGEIDANEFNMDWDGQPFLTTLAVGSYEFEGIFDVMQADEQDRFHTLRVLFGDGCNNRVSVYFPFQIIDCKGPAPSCINGLTVNLMPQPEAQDIDGDGLSEQCWTTAYAAHFEASAIYDCTGEGPELAGDRLRVRDYAIYLDSEASVNGFEPDRNRDSLFITEHRDTRTVVRIYAFDEQGNYDYCTTDITVRNPDNCEGHIPTEGRLTGLIRMQDDEPVEGVQVSLNGSADSVYMTNINGRYILDSLMSGNDYTLTPNLEGDIDNGVTTFDIVLLNKHILGTDTIDSPYRLIAADVNRSGDISIRDIIQMRKVILNIDTVFSANTSWRFIPSEYVFPDPTDPWAEEFPEVSSINDLGAEEVNINFVGIKVGDVNESARANSQEE